MLNLIPRLVALFHPTFVQNCRQPHVIHIFNDDEDSSLTFGQVPLGESMSSSDNDSKESDPSEDSLSFGPSAFDPKATTTTTTVTFSN